MILIYFFIAVGLSMDAFSLALAYGTNNIKFKKIILLSLIVGIFHFIMPLLGSIIGTSIINNLINKSNIIVAVVFILLAIEMFISRNEEKKVTINNLSSMIIFAITVSIDSLSVGIALSLTEKNPAIAYLIFSITSFTFTFLGLILGKKINDKFGKKAIYLGIIILLILSVKYLLLPQ